MIRFFNTILILTLSIPAVLCADYPPAPPKNEAIGYGQNIQRTMNLLVSSTATKRNKVKVLFYGQSITKQNWWKEVARHLRETYPHADLTIENRAIGGFSSPVLIRPAEHDVYPFYPDLIIFHVYGPETEYEQIIKNMRSRTTAEVMMYTDHITWLPSETGENDQERMKRYEWHNRHCENTLPEIAEKYGCELVDVRNPWREYLKENQLKPSDLLRDGVHLNEHGNSLLAELVKRHLHYDPSYSKEPWEDLVSTYRVGEDVHWQNGTLTLPFDGNRVDVVSDNEQRNHPGSGTILIDGKKPSEFPECYAFTRPTDTVGVDWPAIIQVSSKAPLIVEEWTARILDITDVGDKFRFEVVGSKTGFDGFGSHERTFVSNSKRVVIKPENWWLERGVSYSKQIIPLGFEIIWTVKPMFTDVYQAPRIKDPTKEYITTLAQGLANGEHTMEIISESQLQLPIEEVRVYRPPVRID